MGGDEEVTCTLFWSVIWMWETLEEVHIPKWVEML